MKLFLSTILVLGVVIGHTQGAPGILSGVLPRPLTKYDSNSKGLDLESIDLDSLGSYDKDKPQSNYEYNKEDSSPYDQKQDSYDTSSTYDKKPSLYDQASSYDKKPSSAYDLGESLLNPGNIYESLPIKSHYKKADLSELFGGYNQLHNLGGTTKRLLSPVHSYGLVEDVPYLRQGQDYASNLLYKLPTGQQLQCVVLN